jgi:tRNA threonylcarbamoyl adenosine modification protein YeaZ
MKMLLLDAATEKSFFALLSGDSVLFHELPKGPELSKKLALEVSSALEKHQFIPDCIGVGSGPGSLTGVRVALSFARSLAFGWNIPCFEFCSLQIFVPETIGPFAVLVDARSGGIYALLGNQDADGIQWETPQLLSPEALEPILAPIPTILSPHPHLITPRIPSSQNTLDLKAAVPVGLSRFLKNFGKNFN